MISFRKASKRFGHKVLFEDVDWMIHPGDRIGLVGANGTGKSTLLKVIGGFETLDHGEFSFMKGLRVGYLPQDGLRLEGRSVFAECLSVFAGLHEMEREMESLAHQLGELDPSSEAYRAVADRYGQLETEFRNRDGFVLEAQVGTVLAGLGFSKEDWLRPTEEFSGGWQMRIALAKLLLERPDILLLDEPTNHLDLEARNWLEDYLNQYPHAFVLISHDRYFLNVTVTKVAEIWNKRITLYKGNYEKYLQQKAERLEQLQAAYKNQQERIAQLEAFINRFRYQATKAKQVQSRLKELEKIERIEIPPEEKTIHFRFPQPRPSGRIVAEFEGVAKTFGAKTVFRDASFVIERGERIALVGHNGAGKSTLIKLLAGLEPLSAGVYRLGHNVDVDYFAQDQYKTLDAEARVLDDLRTLAPRRTETELRNILGCFLFSEEDVFKKIGVLSGGERNRYALARMLLQPSNFLLLDEPTNHLDMRAKDVLLGALDEFTGTLVFVSHDRYFIDKLATRIFEVGGGQITAHPGNYAEYLWRKAQDQSPELAAAAGFDRKPAPTASGVKAAKKMNPQRLEHLRKKAAQIEAEIARLEEEAAALQTRLASANGDAASLALQLGERRTRITQLEAEWEEVTSAMES